MKKYISSIGHNLASPDNALSLQTVFWLSSKLISSSNALDWINKISPFLGSVSKSGIAPGDSLPVEMRHTPQFKSEADNYIDLPDLIKNWKYFEKNLVYYIYIIHPALVNII